jgi:hypothetical protein
MSCSLSKIFFPCWLIGTEKFGTNDSGHETDRRQHSLIIIHGRNRIRLAPSQITYLWDIIFYDASRYIFMSGYTRKGLCI